jgi:hypothetical protein
MAPGSPYSRVLVVALIFSLLAAVYFQAPAQAQSSTPNVIAIGDSLTDDFGNGGWRGPLKTKLSAAGQSINYVGSRTAREITRPMVELRRVIFLPIAALSWLRRMEHRRHGIFAPR